MGRPRASAHAPAPTHRDAANMGLGMSAARRVVCVCLSCLAVAACGSSGGSASSNRQAITHMFLTLQSSMARGDYAGACQWLSQNQQATIISGAKRAGLNASSCAGAFSALIKSAGVSKAQLAQAFGGTQAPKFHSIVVHGNQATITYTATMGGQTFTETDGLVRENGTWKADRTISRHDGG
jgi:hypothetical protein